MQVGPGLCPNTEVMKSATTVLTPISTRTIKPTHGTATKRVHGFDSNISNSPKIYTRNQHRTSAQFRLQSVHRPQNLYAQPTQQECANLAPTSRTAPKPTQTSSTLDKNKCNLGTRELRETGWVPKSMKWCFSGSRSRKVPGSHFERMLRSFW